MITQELMQAEMQERMREAIRIRMEHEVLSSTVARSATPNKRWTFRLPSIVAHVLNPVSES